MVKKIVWCGNSFYGSPFKVGCNYYSELLAKHGNKVLFISPPISPFHNKNKNKTRFNQAKKKIFKAFENYFVYTPFTLLPPVKKLPSKLFFIVKNWHKFTLPSLTKLLKNFDWLEVDILVIDYFAFLPMLDVIKAKKVIVRVTDNISEFNVGGSPIIAERELIKRADKVVYTSYFLKNYVEQYNKNAIYVSNGVDFHKFQGKFEKPDLLRKINKPIAIYIGAIENWFDYKLLYYVANSLKDIYFLIIGDVKYKDVYYEKCKQLFNVNFYGKIENNLVPNYLTHSNVGIIPFKMESKLVNFISPIKLYEYMACGLPVVSVEWDELKHINSPAFLSKTKEEFLENIKKALKVPDSEKAKYKNFAKANDWENKISKIID